MNLRKLSQDCEFGTLCDSLIKDVTIVGTLDNRLRERLLGEHNLTLENTIKHCKATEETKQYAKILQHQLHSEKTAVYAVKKKPLQKDKQAKANDYFKNCKFLQALINVKVVQCFQRSVKVVKKLVTLLNVAPNKSQ